MATETNRKTNETQISSISSTFSDMKTMLDDFRQGLPDYIDKIISKKLDEQDAISLHANLTNIDEDSASKRVNNNGDTDTPVQNNRDKVPIIQMQIKVLQQGESLKSIQIPQQKSYLEIEKRHGSKDDDELPLKISREILNLVDDDLGL